MIELMIFPAETRYEIKKYRGFIFFGICFA